MILVLQTRFRKPSGSEIGYDMLSVVKRNNGKKAGNQENLANENVDVNKAARW